MTRQDGSRLDTAGSERGALLVYAWYRTFLAAVLILLFSWGLERAQVLGNRQPVLFLGTVLAYLAIALVSQFLLRRARLLPGTVLAMVVTDVVALAVLIHTSGGPQSNLGPLLVPTVAASAILLGGRLTYLVASVATLAMLYEQVYFDLQSGNPLYGNATLAGVLGMAFFGVAFTAALLVSRLQRSEALAQRRARELQELEQLNAHIIQRMRTGILVVDGDRRVRLANSAARLMLSTTPIGEAASLEDVSPELARRLEGWQADPEQRFATFRNHPAGPEIDATLATVRLQELPATLFFLEDMSFLTQHLQQMKLASLGRLTASIAHEIRNPLSAISHAAQLLDESEKLAAEDRRLAQIVQQQALRLDRTVENVLQLSRRQMPRLDLLELVSWLGQFRLDALALRRDDDDIELKPLQPRVRVRFDPHHLQQVLSNLCENGLRHGRKHAGRGVVTLEADVEAATELPVLRIYDNGPGVPADKVPHLFEPFFTTEASGTGLGLYIARELCEANRARLAWVPANEDSEKRGHFRLTFAHPGRTAS